MREEAMGSDLIDVMEAAELLGVSHRSVHHFVRQGLLKPRYPRGRKLNAPELFLREEVSALVEARERKLDFRQVGTVALQAHASSRALERRVEFLEQLLGRSYATLPLDEEDVVALYSEAREGIEVPPTDVTSVMRWSGIFLSMSEEFLEVLTAITNDIEAWKVFLDLSSAMLRDAPLDVLAYDKELEAAYGYFKYARENMRRVLYFHVRNQYGPRTANHTLSLPEEDVHEGVLRLLGGVFSTP
jgi:hypothetical protein